MHTPKRDIYQLYNMSKFRKSRRRKSSPSKPTRHKSSRISSAPTITNRTDIQEPWDAEGEDEVWFSATWSESRAGATSNRGFNFQTAVGSWLAARLVAGELIADSLVPEGFDDFHLEKQLPVQYEVKSRQNRLGPFPVHEAVGHLITAWVRHKDRFNINRKLVVVLEQGIVGVEPPSQLLLSETPVTWLLDQVTGLKERLTRELAKHGRPIAELDELTFTTSVVLCSWAKLDADCAKHISTIADLPPAGLPRLTNELRSEVADAINTNAEASYSDRCSLDRTSLISVIHQTVELFDRESIEHALYSGICSPIDKQYIDISDKFYEGISTQPGHVNAGLAIPRPDLMQQAAEGFAVYRPVLFTGPSGIGKSAALWMLPHAFPGILWFRVHHATPIDIPHIVRLLRAFGVSQESQVGLLFDAVGQDEFNSWELLQTAVMQISGALLVGTVRNEDLFTLGDLADSHIVRISLNNESAAAIHAGLLRRGATTLSHWQEALEQSDRLTLEYTHLLTKGTRLQSVLDAQVSDRLLHDRFLELSILALVATADAWHASIQFTALEEYLQVSSVELRVAMERLVDEHLLTNYNGSLRGTHQIRSRGLVNALHRTPPPTLIGSVAAVLNLLNTDSIPLFIFSILRDIPDLEPQILPILETVATKTTLHLIEILRGLDMLDFHRQATTWIKKLDRAKLPTAHQPLAMFYAIAKLEIPSMFPSEFQLAIKTISNLSAPSQSRVRLIESLSITYFANCLAKTKSPHVAQRLLRALGRIPLNWNQLLASLKSNYSLTNFLGTCSISDLGEFFSTVRAVSPDFALACSDLAGGRDRVLQRTRAEDPWIQELSVVIREGMEVITARFLHVSDALQPEPDKKAVKLGKQLLRVLPEINKVDVKAVRADGSTLDIKGYEYTTSGLVREYDLHPDEVDWNRNRFHLAQTLIGISETERLVLMLDLLPQVATLVREFGNAFVLAPGWNEAKITTQFERLIEQRNSLGEQGRWLPPPLRSQVDMKTDQVIISDCLSGFIIKICCNVLVRIVSSKDGYVALSTYINETVLGKEMPELQQQPWRFVGVSQYPPVLDDLASSLSDISALLTAMASDSNMNTLLSAVVQRGSQDEALIRAAEFARHLLFKKAEARRHEVKSHLKISKRNIEVFWLNDDEVAGRMSKFVVTVHVTSLFDDWLVVIDQLVARLKKVHVTPVEVPFFVPVLNGSMILRCGLKLLSGDLIPVVDSEWVGSMKLSPLDERLTLVVESALQCLSVCSSLSTLGNENELDGRIRSVLETAVSNFSSSIDEVAAMGDDDVVSGIANWLWGLAQQVQDEWDGQREPGTLSAVIEDVSWSSQVVSMPQHVVVTLLALHWDADPLQSVRLLESWSDD